MAPAFWNGRRVLITGHTGFKGGWLALWLQELGATVYGYALAPEAQPNLFEVAEIAYGMESVIADIRDATRLEKAFEAARPEIVFHLAAQPLVRRSYVKPRETYETNVMGTVNLLEAVRACDSVRAVVIVTSDKCYDNREWEWGYRESDPMGGHDPYSNSKGCAELVTAAFRSSFFAPSAYQQHRVCVASVRAGNVIGGGDWSEDRLIPDFVRAVRRREPLRIRNPHAIRPWQHVLEPLSGYLMLAEGLAMADARLACAWNFGPNEDDARSVAWIADQLVTTWGEDASWISDEERHPHEATYLKLDSSRARRLLGWQPKLRIEEAIRSLAGWYKAVEVEENMRDFTLTQIRHYAARPPGT